MKSGPCLKSGYCGVADMIAWDEIDTVLLDMDGTLLDLSFDNFFWLEYLPQRYAEEKSVSLGKSKALLEARSVATFGSLDWYCLDHWSRDLDMDIAALKREVHDRICFRPGATDFLAYLRQHKRSAILVTNAHPVALQIKLESSGLDQHIERRISTHEFQLAKENAGFWPRLAEREGLDLSRCVLIDDSHRVLARAREEGIPHLFQVLQPDSRQAPAETSAFTGIVDFSELMETQQALAK